MTHLPTLPVGFSPVPDGHLAAVVTYLEMNEPPASRTAPTPVSMPELVRLGAADLVAYRELYRAVGEAWLWFSRALLDDAQLADILGDPRVEAYAVRLGADTVGLVELDFREAGSCELAFFGLVDAAVGQGLGRWLMQWASEQAWSHAIDRFHVHTCTLDHPVALPFYIRSGFVPVRRTVEVAPDPRRLGALDAHAGPHAPVIG